MVRRSGKSFAADPSIWLVRNTRLADGGCAQADISGALATCRYKSGVGCMCWRIMRQVKKYLGRESIWRQPSSPTQAISPQSRALKGVSGVMRFAESTPVNHT